MTGRKLRSDEGWLEPKGVKELGRKTTAMCTAQ
jgi:hypothetical protein